MLRNGGDFADGVVADDGHRLGGETFLSFDRKAVSILAGKGQQARLLTGRQPHRMVAGKPARYISRVKTRTAA